MIGRIFFKLYGPYRYFIERGVTMVMTEWNITSKSKVYKRLRDAGKKSEEMLGFLTYRNLV